MKSNNTQYRRLKTGDPRIAGCKTYKKRFSPALSSNYKMVLQVYCLNKEAAAKKELTHQKNLGKSLKTTSKRSFSLLTWMTPFFTANVTFFKKVRQGISLVTE